MSSTSWSHRSSCETMTSSRVDESFTINMDESTSRTSSTSDRMGCSPRDSDGSVSKPLSNEGLGTGILREIQWTGKVIEVKPDKPASRPGEFQQHEPAGTSKASAKARGDAQSSQADELQQLLQQKENAMQAANECEKRASESDKKAWLVLEELERSRGEAESEIERRVRPLEKLLVKRDEEREAGRLAMDTLEIRLGELKRELGERNRALKQAEDKLQFADGSAAPQESEVVKGSVEALEKRLCEAMKELDCQRVACHRAEASESNLIASSAKQEQFARDAEYALGTALLKHAEELADRRATAEALEMRLAEVNAEYGQQKSKIDTEASEAKKLRACFSEVQFLKQELRHVESKNLEKLEGERTKTEALEIKFDELTQQLDKETQACERAFVLESNQRADLEERLTLEKRRSSALELALKERDSETETWKMTVDALEQRVCKLTWEVEQLALDPQPLPRPFPASVAPACDNGLGAEVADLKERLIRSTEGNMMLQEEVDLLREERVCSVNLSQQVSELQTLLAKNMDSCVKLQEEKEDLQTENESLKKEAAILQQRILQEVKEKSEILRQTNDGLKESIIQQRKTDGSILKRGNSVSQTDGFAQVTGFVNLSSLAPAGSGEPRDHNKMSAEPKKQKRCAGHSQEDLETAWCAALTSSRHVPDVTTSSTNLPSIAEEGVDEPSEEFLHDVRGASGALSSEEAVRFAHTASLCTALGELERARQEYDAAQHLYIQQADAVTRKD